MGTRGIVKGEVELSGIPPDQVATFMQHVSSKLHASNITYRLCFHVEYGPVWGGWRSDVERFLLNAVVNSRAKVEIEKIEVVRTVVD